MTTYTNPSNGKSKCGNNYNYRDLFKIENYKFGCLDMVKSENFM